MHRRSSGFTIVELLVVIVVIGILATIVIVSYTGISSKASEASVVADLSNANKQFKLFQVENSNYPANIELNCVTPANPANKCMKLSNGNTLGVFYVNNTASPQVFCLTIKGSGDLKKNINQDGVMADGACTYPFPSTLAANGTAPTSSTIYLSWASISGTIDSYTLERATDNAFTTNKTTLTAPSVGATTYSSTGLTSATTYYYRLSVTMNGDTSNWSNVATNSTKATLAISAGAGGTVNTAVNGVYTLNATPTITATPNGGYLFSSWSGTGCAGAASHIITMDANKTCVANFAVDPWIDGVGALAGKHVYNVDAGIYTWDSGYPSFTIGCAAGGRWPNLTELQAMYTNRASYGNNFQADFYWSSTEYGSGSAYYVYFYYGDTYGDYKSLAYYVRCVSG